MGEKAELSGQLVNKEQWVYLQSWLSNGIIWSLLSTAHICFLLFLLHGKKGLLHIVSKIVNSRPSLGKIFTDDSGKIGLAHIPIFMAGKKSHFFSYSMLVVFLSF